MSKRKSMNYKSSKKLFTRTAKKVHPRNGKTVMRGGIRM